VVSGHGLFGSKRYEFQLNVFTKWPKNDFERGLMHGAITEILCIGTNSRIKASVDQNNAEQDL
jgi:hypothetical protein